MKTTVKETMADVLVREARELGGLVYCSKPYPCALTEALTTFKKYDAPDKLDIERADGKTVIKIKPLKGSRKRKPYVIMLWH